MVKYKRFGIETEYDQIILEVFSKQNDNFSNCNFKYNGGDLKHLKAHGSTKKAIKEFTGDINNFYVPVGYENEYDGIYVICFSEE
jgi:hypothetical protein